MLKCMDCRYYAMGVSNNQPIDHLCSHPSNVSPIDGSPDLAPCLAMRSALGSCGVTGKLWAAKDMAVPPETSLQVNI